MGRRTPRSPLARWRSAQGPFSIAANVLAPPSYPAQWPAPFNVIPTTINVSGPTTFDWDFGDGSPRGTNQSLAHAYAIPGTYQWTLTVGVKGGTTTVSTNLTGSIAIGAPVSLTATPTGNSIRLTWPQTVADALVEQSAAVGTGGVDGRNQRCCERRRIFLHCRDERRQHLFPAEKTLNQQRNRLNQSEEALQRCSPAGVRRYAKADSGFWPRPRYGDCSVRGTVRWRPREDRWSNPQEIWRIGGWQPGC